MTRQEQKAAAFRALHAGEPLDRATDLPVSVDLENSYSADPESAARAFTRVAEAGAVAPRSRTTIPAAASTTSTTPSKGSPPP